MESLKRPEMVLSVANTVGLIGVVTYFNKQQQSLQAELVKVSDHLSSTIKKIAELQGQCQQINKVVEMLNRFDTVVRDVRTLSEDTSDQLNDLQEKVNDDAETLTGTLEESGIFVQLGGSGSGSNKKARKGGRGARRSHVKEDNSGKSARVKSKDDREDTRGDARGDARNDTRNDKDSRDDGNRRSVKYEDREGRDGRETRDGRKDREGRGRDGRRDDDDKDDDIRSYVDAERNRRNRT